MLILKLKNKKKIQNNINKKKRCKKLIVITKRNNIIKNHKRITKTKSKIITNYIIINNK
jgi:hypothetical protein